MGKITRPSTVLKRARQIIDEGRWCKGTEKSTNKKGDAKFCAVGATAEALHAVWHREKYHDGHLGEWYVDHFAAGDHHTYELANQILDDTVEAVTNGKFRSIVIYNDVPQRTRKQMLAMFDAAIVEAERIERHEARQRRRSLAVAK